jgi:hypothetical protein
MTSAISVLAVFPCSLLQASGHMKTTLRKGQPKMKVQEASTTVGHFLKLPAEIRVSIYDLVLSYPYKITSPAHGLSVLTPTTHRFCQTLC